MTDAIAWALVHFLWQGAALACVAWLLMRLASSSSVRYLIGVATMTAMVISVGLTAATTSTAAAGPQMVQSPTDLAVHGSTAAGQGAAGLARRSLGEGGSRSPEVRGLPTTWILTIWIIGVVALSIRALGGWLVARRVALDAITPLSDDLQAAARALAERLGIRRVVRVVESSRVAVPVMIGWLRPVVLMPPAALSGLSIAQVEAIFAHEFAHIRRHDYLVNLLQTAVETALFFHPAVWWLSRAVRRERELCCDDLAVTVSDRLTYATALSALAHIQPPPLALAATDGSLRDRVRRIITNPPTSESAKGGWMAMLPLLLVVSLAAPSALTQSVAVPPNVVPVLVQTPPPTKPKEVPVVVTPTPARRLTISADQIEIVPESRSNPEINQLLDEQLALERRRLDLEKERLQNDSALELRSLELNVQNDKIQLEELRKKVQAGIESAGTFRNWENSQKLGIAKLETAKRTLDLKLMELTLREQELVLKRRMQKAGMDASIERAVEVTPALKRLSGAEAVRPGDVVTIVIDGVSDGTRDFKVDAAGSIRHPQVGDVAVAEHSTSGVREKIIKLLVTKGFATDPTVTVIVRR